MHVEMVVIFPKSGHVWWLVIFLVHSWYKLAARVFFFKDILAYNNDETISRFPFPIIADGKRELAVELGMLDPNEKDQSGMPLTARCVSTTRLHL